MQHIHDFLKDFNKNVHAVEKIAASGSGRINYKVFTENETYIVTENQNVKENQTFFYLSQLLKNLNGNVPEVVKINSDSTLYIQTCVGKESLLEKRLKGDDVTDLYTKSVISLAKLQIAAAQIVDTNQLFDSIEFNQPLVYRDLFYFKNYFIDFTPIQYKQSGLLNDFEKLAQRIENSNYKYFMFRDFQGRNIMIKNNEPYFIDYQDAMLGPMAYDLVSLLWQAKASLSIEEKQRLVDVFVKQIKKLIPNQFNLLKFMDDYNNCLTIRLLQVLGAYGKLGIIQNKPHFKESIKFGISNLKSIQNESFMNDFPTLKNIINQLNQNSIPKI